MLKTGFVVGLSLFGVESAAIGENHLRGQPVVGSKVELPLNVNAAERLKQVSPLAWMHVPNSGTHFVNTLMNMPGVCDKKALMDEVESMRSHGGQLVFHKNLQKHGHVMSRHEKRHGRHIKKRVQRRGHRKEEEKRKEWKEHGALLEVSDVPTLGSLQNFAARYKLRAACHGMTQSYQWWTHQGFGSAYKANAGKGVLSLRQPEQRLLSGWYHSDTLWRTMTFLEYAKNQSGCVVKMLTRSHNSPCEDTTPPTKEERQLAKRRLVEGFAFVGLADRWSRSVGLFHRMFGGQCRDYELLDEKADSFKEYDVAILEGFVDVYDGELYNQARKIFTDNMKRYGVSYDKPLEHCTPAAKK